MKESMPILVRGDARCLPLPDESVDLICTSPPYFGLRDYGTAEQIGTEASPGEFIASLIDVTREMVRVLKPHGSMFVNLGDKYAGGGGQWDGDERSDGCSAHGSRRIGKTSTGGRTYGLRHKSLLLLPERYRIACVDEVGLIARATVVWSKPNGMPESVTDRVRRSHEDWVHLVKSPRYFAEMDELRESPTNYSRKAARRDTPVGQRPRAMADSCNPAGRLPGSVWEVPTQGLRVPDGLGADHYAAFPMEWPRRLITGWCPPGGTVLDPFGGTGTTALVATMRGRTGISVELSEDYQRIARWRCSDPKERARAAGLNAAAVSQISPSIPGQSSLFDDEEAS